MQSSISACPAAPTVHITTAQATEIFFLPKFYPKFTSTDQTPS